MTGRVIDAPRVLRAEEFAEQYRLWREETDPLRQQMVDIVSAYPPPPLLLGPRGALLLNPQAGPWDHLPESVRLLLEFLQDHIERAARERGLTPP